MTVDVFRFGPMIIMTSSLTDVTGNTVLFSELEIRDNDFLVLFYSYFNKDLHSDVQISNKAGGICKPL